MSDRHVYVTHHFAHVETLDRAERWLLQRGFPADRLEVHREGVPRISVYCTRDEADQAALIVKAAEAGDPDGWPSVWTLARMPHPHAEPAADPTATVVQSTARSAPVGWHPADVRDAAENPHAFKDVWDVTTRFA